jgi:hexaprenyl-diphosphate synthase
LLNLGQLSEDASAFEMGFSDLRPGLATAPALFAWEEYPEMRPYIRRNFSAKGDFEEVSIPLYSIYL